jgi:hypothetical protein
MIPSRFALTSKATSPFQEEVWTDEGPTVSRACSNSAGDL